MRGNIRLWGRRGLWLAASLTAVIPSIRPSLATDDVVVERPDTTPRSRKPAPADPPSPRGPGFVVSLANGDRLTGRIVATDDTRLSFRPDVARDGELDIALPQIARVERSKPQDPVEPRGDRVYPRAGGMLQGTLVRVSPRTLTLDVHLVGQVQLPLAALAMFVREGRELPIRTATSDLHEVFPAAGEPLIGEAAFTAGGLTVSHQGVKKEIPLHTVEAIAFPVREPPEPPDQVSPPGACVLKLLNGCEFVGTSPQFDRDQITVAMTDVGRVAVPLAHMDRLSFGAHAAAFGGPKRVVFWSACADRDEEVRHMADALTAGLPKAWKLDTPGDHPELADLEADLTKAGVLVVPEMEEFNGEKLPEPEKLGKVVRAFLERGGTVVLAGLGDKPAAYWKSAGLISLTANKRDNEAEFRLLKGSPLADGVGDSFTSVNATQVYETDDPQFEAVASRDGGGATVLVKRVGRGTMVLLGMDYFATSDAVNRLLVNAVTIQRGQR